MGFWNWNREGESMFSLSFGTKAILFVTATGVLLFGVGYALSSFDKLIDDEKDKSLNLNDVEMQSYEDCFDTDSLEDEEFASDDQDKKDQDN